MSSFHGILIHVVFGPKQRCNVLAKSWRDELYGVLGGNIKKHEGTLLKAGGVEDHVHLLMKTHPSYAIADTIKLFKGNSSKWINANQKMAARFAWQRRYGAFSVSESMSDTVKRYIENQETHHRGKSFRDEFVELLDKHRIAFEDRYLFEDEHYG